MPTEMKMVDSDPSMENSFGFENKKDPSLENLSPNQMRSSV